MLANGERQPTTAPGDVLLLGRGLSNAEIAEIQVVHEFR
jgi:hypothetical protein